MGLFWDLIQQSQIQDHKSKAESLEVRVRNLEWELANTRELLIKTLKILEEQSGRDIDGDGRIG
ncbi:hypothetical protein SAMN04489724_2155 [Algoriphagus locisalis]|uniref:Uncharacterized protein n=1 Tax=Algoriphagus locisalis TaxID=305507 RepID=A0A1I7ARR5_9BACT|nr:hypothetical protein [Algoriphagus locisalis]SFT77566.1 hypothetical protein SAMN04489724_2155 [Algoriphagus locisalis]